MMHMEPDYVFVMWVSAHTFHKSPTNKRKRKRNVAFFATWRQFFCPREALKIVTQNGLKLFLLLLLFLLPECIQDGAKKKRSKRRQKLFPLWQSMTASFREFIFRPLYAGFGLSNLFQFLWGLDHPKGLLVLALAISMLRSGVALVRELKAKTTTALELEEDRGLKSEFTFPRRDPRGTWPDFPI